MGFQRYIFLSAIPALAMICCNSDGAVVIDDFSVGPLVIFSENGVVNTAMQPGLDAMHVIGGRRDVSFRYLGPPPGTSMEIDTAAAQLRVNPGAACCSYLNVDYGNMAVPLNLDLTQDGSNGFEFSFAPIAAGSVYRLPTIRAIDGQNRTAELVTISMLPVNPENGFVLTVPFSQFPLFDFTDIQSIHIFTIRYPAGMSFALNHIVTVPEPTTLALVLPNVAGLCYAWRRRQVRL
jgi:hypothetical protein